MNHSTINRRPRDITSFSRRMLIAIAILLGVNHSAGADGISDNEADQLRAAILLSGVAATGVFRDREGFFQYGKTIIATSAATLVLKELVESERPNGEDKDSFPSGHVSVSAAGAVFLHQRYGLKIGLPAYLATAAISHNRLENNHHRTADVIASIALAVAINKRVTSRWTVTPSVSGESLGLQLKVPL